MTIVKRVKRGFVMDLKSSKNMLLTFSKLKYTFKELDSQIVTCNSCFFCK